MHSKPSSHHHLSVWICCAASQTFHTDGRCNILQTPRTFGCSMVDDEEIHDFIFTSCSMKYSVDETDRRKKNWNLPKFFTRESEELSHAYSAHTERVCAKHRTIAVVEWMEKQKINHWKLELKFEHFRVYSAAAGVKAMNNLKISLVGFGEVSPHRRCTTDCESSWIVWKTQWKNMQKFLRGWVNFAICICTHNKNTLENWLEDDDLALQRKKNL